MNLEAATQQMQSVFGGLNPKVGLVLGSGLSYFAETALTDQVTLPYAEIPGFPVSTVAGHAGRWVGGRVGETPVLCMQGRVHYYEGYDAATITLPIRLLKRLGVEALILTNAAGGINRAFTPGDLMLIEDHINFMGTHPLRGPNDASLGPRFPDMTAAWDAALREKAVAIADRLQIPLQRGVYLAVSGPSFETPAEIRAFRQLGADAVGMSTVPECLVARHAGMRVVGFSCITNCAAGHNEEPLTHEEVAETADRVREPFSRLLAGMIRELA